MSPERAKHPPLNSTAASVSWCYSDQVDLEATKVGSPSEAHVRVHVMARPLGPPGPGPERELAWVLELGPEPEPGPGLAV